MRVAEHLLELLEGPLASTRQGQHADVHDVRSMKNTRVLAHQGLDEHPSDEGESLPLAVRKALIASTTPGASGKLALPYVAIFARMSSEDTVFRT
jgi:hypothetical protein